MSTNRWTLSFHMKMTFCWYKALKIDNVEQYVMKHVWECRTSTKDNKLTCTVMENMTVRPFLKANPVYNL